MIKRTETRTLTEEQMRSFLDNVSKFDWGFKPKIISKELPDGKYAVTAPLCAWADFIITNWRDAIPLKQALYRCHGCEAGGPIHVIIEDGNVEDHFIDRAIVNLETPGTWENNFTEDARNAAMALALEMQKMSITQRKKLVAI